MGQSPAVGGCTYDLTFALWKALAEMVPQRCWSLLERFSVRIAQRVSDSIAARSLPNTVRDRQSVIRDALLDRGLTDIGKIIVPADVWPTALVAEVPRRTGSVQTSGVSCRPWRGLRWCAHSLGSIAVLGEVSMRWNTVFATCRS